MYRKYGIVVENFLEILRYFPCNSWNFWMKLCKNWKQCKKTINNSWSCCSIILKILETFWINNNFAEVIEKFFWSFGKIWDFSEGVLKNVWCNELILEKFWWIREKTYRTSNDNEISEIWVKFQRNFLEQKIVGNLMTYTLKKCNYIKKVSLWWFVTEGD